MLLPRLTGWVRRLLRFLPADVKKLLDRGHYLARRIFDFHKERRLVLLLSRHYAPNFLNLLVRQSKLGAHCPATRFAEANAGGFVPNDEVLTEVMNQHEHVEGVGDGVERASVMRADVVAVPKVHPQLHVNGLHVGIHARDSDAGAKQRRPEVDKSQEIRSGHTNQRPCSSKNFSTSIAAMQPVPDAVMA